MSSANTDYSYKIPVVDDDPAYQYMMRALLKNEFEVITVGTAQEAIDHLSENPVNLVITDIHMPGMTGLELLESLKIDATKREIPMLVITSLPNPEVEQQAADLGAADFIRKEEIVSNRQEVLERVRMKLVSNIEFEDLDESLDARKQAIVSGVMNQAIKGDVEQTVEHLCKMINNNMNVDYAGFWQIDEGKKVKKVRNYGSLIPGEEALEKAKQSSRLRELISSGKAIFSNNVGGGEQALLPDFSRDNQLIFEAAVPLFALSERELLMNRKQLPAESELFALLILKRKKVCSTREFELIKRIVQQLGSIIWRLSQKNSQATSS